jgi:hypothetical protein
MAIPNGSGGYQVGDGNLSEVQLNVQATPVAKTAAAVLTAAELTNGIVTYSGAVANITLPTVALTEALVSSAKVNSSFDFSILNIGGTNTATVVAGTGWTLVGVVTVLALVSSTWRAVKTGDGAWSAYRLA